MSPTCQDALERAAAGEHVDVFVTPSEAAELFDAGVEYMIVDGLQPGVAPFGEEGGWWCWVSLAPAA